jgi:hypothetical protein
LSTTFGNFAETDELTKQTPGYQRWSDVGAEKAELHEPHSLTPGIAEGSRVEL